MFKKQQKPYYTHKPTAIAILLFYRTILLVNKKRTKAEDKLYKKINKIEFNWAKKHIDEYRSIGEIADKAWQKTKDEFKDLTMEPAILLMTLASEMKQELQKLGLKENAIVKVATHRSFKISPEYELKSYKFIDRLLTNFYEGYISGNK